jgi:hypothetical protein
MRSTSGSDRPTTKDCSTLLPDGGGRFCRLFIGKLTTFEGMRSRPVLVGEVGAAPVEVVDVAAP